MSFLEREKIDCMCVFFLRLSYVHNHLDSSSLCNILLCHDLSEGCKLIGN